MARPDLAHRGRGHEVEDRQLGEGALLLHVAQGVDEGHEGAGDGGGAGAAVGLDDVAVDPEGALAEGLHVDDRPQRAADEALDLVGAAGGRPPRPASRWRAGDGGAGQHAVLGGDPALALALQEGGHPLLDAHGADDPVSPTSTRHEPSACLV